jgi:RNA ligase (TIGR02306 family)
MRKLASIERIIDIVPIENADRIEVAKVLGWNLIVKKDSFSIGDFCVYFEVDSLIPEEILKKANLWDEETDKGRLDGKEGNRLKTRRLRGVVSQGLALPLSDFSFSTECVEGNDVTELLGVEKYEPPISVQLAGKVKGIFPSFLKKTDSTRLQGYPKLLDEFKGLDCYVTIKIDGTSSTYYNFDNEFGVCSRNMNLLETEGNTYWEMARKYNLEELTRGRDICIQGETYGEGIQANRLGVSGHNLAIFDIYDIKSGNYFNYEDFKEFCIGNGLPMVDVIYEGEFKWGSIDELIEYSSAQNYGNGKPAEGIVIRPMVERYSNVLGERLACKVISPRFLVKYGE